MRALLLGLMLLATTVSAQAPLPRLSQPTRVGGTTFDFGRVDYAAASRQGEVAVADGDNYRIYRFAANGSLRDSIAGRGQGPGEFLAAAGLRFDDAGRLYLTDIQTRRWTMWEGGRAPVHQQVVTGGRPLHMLQGSTAPFLLLTDFVKEVHGLFLEGRRATPYPSRLDLTSLPVAECFQCALVPLDHGGWLVAATEDSTYRVIEYDRNGKQLKGWQRLPERPKRRTDAELAELSRQFLQPPGGANSPERAGPPDMERFRYPRRIRVIERDGAGRFWMLANHADRPVGTFDVFRADGTFLGTMTVAEPVRSFAIHGDHLVAWGEDADDVPAVWRYRILPR